jgi:hypothetical protein
LIAAVGQQSWRDGGLWKSKENQLYLEDEEEEEEEKEETIGMEKWNE